jgi:hypothetical protein
MCSSAELRDATCRDDAAPVLPAPGANPLQVIVSNGIDWLIGNQ